MGADADDEEKADKERIFLDTSALFAGVWSEQGGARMLLKLGEARAVHLLVSADVLAEAEAVLRRKAPDALGLFALLLDRSRVEAVSAPHTDVMEQSGTLVAHSGDAAIVAAAWSAGANYFVTLDRKHLLHNAALRAVAPFAIGTPGDCLAWYRARLSG